jgi:hypothetical protein
MNSKPISSYEDLCREKERLQEMLKAQKVQIQKDLEHIKDEFRPVVSLSENVARLLSREDGKDPIVTAGTNLTIDILVSKLLGKSNFILKMILPAILKNISSHYIPKAAPPKKQSLYGAAMEKTVVEKTVVVKKDQPSLAEH